MEEKWLDIKGFNGQYQISSYGRVKSFKQNKKGKILAFGSSGKYFTVCLRKDGKPINYYIHRLVAEHFLADTYNTTLQVNHKDENPHNNNVENLEWITFEENLHYGTRDKRAILNRSKNIPHKRPVRCIETGIVYESLSQAARQNGVRDTSIRRACLGERKTSNNYHWEFV